MKREIIDCAARVLGGERPLAARLGLDVEAVRKLRSSDQEPPLEIFIELLDILAEAPWRIDPLTSSGRPFHDPGGERGVDASPAGSP